MFTGIIEEIGTVISSIKKHKSLSLRVQGSLVLEDVKVGDSIAVNGVCLTITSCTRNYFIADVIPVTFQSTNLASLRAGSKVNLERAMRANGRFDGHMLSGHIDGVGEIIMKKSIHNQILYKIQIPKALSRYCITKGSVALDGTSLTIVEVNAKWIGVALIPHTAWLSILGQKQVKSTVNIECDMLFKQLIESSSDPLSTTSLSYETLQKHGFI